MQATTSEYKAYQEQVLSNSAKFAQVLIAWRKEKHIWRTIYFDYISIFYIFVSCRLWWRKDMNLFLVELTTIWFLWIWRARSLDNFVVPICIIVFYLFVKTPFLIFFCRELMDLELRKCWKLFTLHPTKTLFLEMFLPWFLVESEWVKIIFWLFYFWYANRVLPDTLCHCYFQVLLLSLPEALLRKTLPK